MAERFKPVPHREDPWKIRFEAEARKYTRFPFPETRKGKPIEAQPKKPRGLKAMPARGKWKYVPG